MGVSPATNPNCTLAKGLHLTIFQIPGLTATGAEYGIVWQGRYTLPLAPGPPILSAEILVRRIPGTTWSGGPVPRALAATIGVTLVIAYLCQVCWPWRRYARGMTHILPLHAHWSPPIGWPATLFLAAIGCGTLLFLLRSASSAITALGGSASAANANTNSVTDPDIGQPPAIVDPATIVEREAQSATA